MCTGRIDPGMVARAFKKGLDGLMVVGCYFGDCHYISGNYQAKAKIEITQKLLDYIGVNKDRLAFRQCSSGEASVFVKLVSEFDAKIKELGPIGQGGDRLDAPEIFEKLKLAEAVLDGEKIRWVIGKRTPFLESGNIYGEIFTEHEYQSRRRHDHCGRNRGAGDFKPTERRCTIGRESGRRPGHPVGKGVSICHRPFAKRNDPVGKRRRTNTVIPDSMTRTNGCKIYPPPRHKKFF